MHPVQLAVRQLTARLMMGGDLPRPGSCFSFRQQVPARSSAPGLPPLPPLAGSPAASLPSRALVFFGLGRPSAAGGGGGEHGQRAGERQEGSGHRRDRGVRAAAQQTGARRAGGKRAARKAHPRAAVAAERAVVQ